MTFESNILGTTWKVHITDLFGEFERTPSLFGQTEYMNLEIHIRESMCDETKYRTLAHEIAHALLYEQGRVDVNTFGKEEVCEFVAHNADYIFKIADDIWKLYKEGKSGV